MTFLETNVGELAAIVRLAASLGVDRVKGHHLWVHFDEIRSLSMRRSPQAIERWNAAVQDAYEAAQQYRLPEEIYFRAKLAHHFEDGTSPRLHRYHGLGHSILRLHWGFAA